MYYGRYFDAVRNNMTDFAGSLTGRVIHEQVWVEEAQEFTTFRIRGGLAQQDGFFAPRIETPYTDEIQLQYKQDLGSNMMIEVNYIDRETSDIMEDYGNLYYDDAVYASLGGDLNHQDNLLSIKKEVKRKKHKEARYIIDAQLLILEDSLLLKSIIDTIKGGKDRRRVSGQRCYPSTQQKL